VQHPLVIAVTGGAGAGKSTAARRFAALGAVVIDADEAAREVLGSPAVREHLVDAFGARVLGVDGDVDRANLADAAFAGPQSAARLDAIMHPPIAELIGRKLDARLGEGDDEVIVIDVPLLGAVPAIAARCGVVLAIEAPQSARVDRLVGRGLTEADALRRIALQPTDAQRREFASAVVVNDADESRFEERLDSVWEHFVGPVALTEGWYAGEPERP
jgi:dephospho-CoA kinase